MGIFKRIAFLLKAEYNAAKNKAAKKIRESDVLREPNESEQTKIETERKEARENFDVEWEKLVAENKKRFLPTSREIVESYKILGATINEDKDNIMKKWRALLKLHHPDKFTDATAQMRALKKTQEINEAWTIVEKHLEEKERNK